MSLVKCKKCKKEISNTVKFCPHCGESTVKQFCKECGHEMAINATSCPSCGFIVNESAFYNQPQVYANNVVDESQGEKYDIALSYSVSVNCCMPIQYSTRCLASRILSCAM